MVDLEKVVTGLECCSVKQSCSECPWKGLDCNDRLHLAALELLKEKEIGHREKSDALLKMWMDNDITDGEYGKIMNRLNKKTLNKKVKKDG